MADVVKWTDNAGAFNNANAVTPMPVAVYTGGSGATATQVQGNVASGAADAGNPVKIGAVGNDTTLTQNANGNRVDLAVNRYGVLYIAAGEYDGTAGGDGRGSLIGLSRRDTGISNTPTPLAVGGYVLNGSGAWDRQRGDVNGIVVQSALSTATWNYATATGGIVNTTTAVTIKTAAGASVRNYLKNLQISADTLGAATELAGWWRVIHHAPRPRLASFNMSSKPEPFCIRRDN